MSKHLNPAATPPDDVAPSTPPAPADAAVTPPDLPATTEDDGLLPPPEPYNPADYRWVPVRRVPRRDGWTEEKLRRFIETLADSGQVGLACKAVGMSRESAYKLRRSSHGAAFARAWDAARHHAGGFLEDVAFERAVEGVEHNIYNEYGEAICTKRVVSDRLLMFLLRHLKPERYGGAAAAPAANPAEPAQAALTTSAPPPEIALEASLRAIEPQLPAPPEQLLDPQTLAAELELAEIADGRLPHFLFEQVPPASSAQGMAEARAAQQQRGQAAFEKAERKEGKLSTREFADMCRYLDPASYAERPRKRYR